MGRNYTTKEIADLIGIHVNTVRFYEEIGFLTSPKRKKNGYRIYTDLQLEQCRIIRCAMKAQIIQNGLRKAAINIVELCAKLDFDASICAAKEYQNKIDNEIKSATAAIDSVERMIQKKKNTDTTFFKRKEASTILGVTSETLRTWERSGLIDTQYREHGYRLYSAVDMERFNIIRTLRCANYSLSSILRLLTQLDKHTTCKVETILNTPEECEDIISVCDQLIISLKSSATDAENLVEMLLNMKEKFSTLQ